MWKTGGTSTLKRFLIAVYDWLDCHGDAREADCIFVHAGARMRRQVALQFYSEGRAPRVLLSMTPSEARYFASRAWPLGDQNQNARDLLANLPAKVHVFVHLHCTQVTVDFVRLGWFGTWGEIQALGHWLEERPQLTSILVISTAPHLRRVRLCCRAALPQHIRISLGAVPPYLFWDRQKWWLLRRTRLAVLWEFPKLLAYWFLALLAPARSSQLRRHLERAQGD